MQSPCYFSGTFNGSMAALSGYGGYNYYSSRLTSLDPLQRRAQSIASEPLDNPAHNAAAFERYKLSLFAEEHANPGDPFSGPVVVTPLKNGLTTAAQVAQLREYAALASLAEREGALSPTGRVSTNGAIERQASRARRLERARAKAAGEPYGSSVAGHSPDSGWVGKGDPPFWLPLDKSINSSLAGQQGRYPINYKPTRFIYDGDF